MVNLNTLSVKQVKKARILLDYFFAVPRKFVPLYCTQLVILIYIYHFPQIRKPSVKTASYFCSPCHNNFISSLIPSEAPFWICVTLAPALTGLGSIR